MSKEAVDADERTILSALDGIVRMQRTIRGGLDVGAATALVSVRIYYNALPKNIARRLTELNPVALAAIPGATAPGFQEGPREHRRECGKRRSLRPGHPGSERLPGEAGL